MRFYEYEAKGLFARHGTPLLAGRVARTPAEAATIAAEIAGPVVLSQVLTGGRMKAGGVKSLTPRRAERAAAHILALTSTVTRRAAFSSSNARRSRKNTTPASPGTASRGCR
jgi:succinyl-CoA synthetase beta subunit